MSEQKNKLEDIRDKDNHCYDALKYAMTFMDDLTPDRQNPRTGNEEFHTAFKTSFPATSKFAEYDDNNEWGASWRSAGAVSELEG